MITTRWVVDARVQEERVPTAGCGVSSVGYHTNSWDAAMPVYFTLTVFLLTAVAAASPLLPPHLVAPSALDEHRPLDLVTAINDLAIASLDARRFPEARALFLRGLALQPANPTVLFNLGVANKELGFWRASIDSYEAALALDPSLQAARFNLGRTWMMVADDRTRTRSGGGGGLARAAEGVGVGVGEVEGGGVGGSKGGDAAMRAAMRGWYRNRTLRDRALTTAVRHLEMAAWGEGKMKRLNSEPGPRGMCLVSEGRLSSFAWSHDLPLHRFVSDARPYQSCPHARPPPTAPLLGLRHITFVPPPTLTLASPVTPSAHTHPTHKHTHTQQRMPRNLIRFGPWRRPCTKSATTGAPPLPTPSTFDGAPARVSAAATPTPALASATGSGRCVTHLPSTRS